MIASPLRYSILCALVLGGLAFLAAQEARLGLVPALLLLPMVAWPAWLALAYPAAVRRIEARASLRGGERPWWGPLLGGAMWRQVAAVPVACLAAWSLCWRLLAEGWVTLAWAAAMAVLVYATAWVLTGRMAPLKAYARPRPILLAAPWIASAMLTMIWALTFGLASLGDGSLAQAVSREPRYEGASALLAWASDATGLLNGARAWTSAWVERQGAWPVAAAWQALGAFGQFWLLALVFAGLLLPPRAARRILRPSDAEEPLPVGPRRAAVAGFGGAILFLFAVSLLARLEGWATLRHSPQAFAEAPGLATPALAEHLSPLSPEADPRPSGSVSGLPTPSEIRRAVEAERLGELVYPQGTIVGLDGLDQGLRAVLTAQREGIEAAAREGFGTMRANVPAYLDWYYSLPAEYARTGHLLIGDAGSYLEEQLRGHLEIGEPLAPLRAAVEDLAGNPERLAEWRQARQALLGGCGTAFLPPDHGALVTTASAPGDILLRGPSVQALDLRTRVGGASVAGGAGGLVGMAVGKLVAKEAFGLAGEALGKLALGKAAGWMGGAAAGAGGGALAGSVVPVLGTTVGAAVGGVLGGVVAWIGTDYALLALDEAISREGFEAEILLAIDEAEAEFLTSLGPS